MFSRSDANNIRSFAVEKHPAFPTGNGQLKATGSLRCPAGRFGNQCSTSSGPSPGGFQSVRPIPRGFQMRFFAKESKSEFATLFTIFPRSTKFAQEYSKAESRGRTGRKL